jgi:hypothetical protein
MADINDNTINITISAPSADSNTISVVNPALKNNVVVNDARITPSERAKLAGIEVGADETNSANVLAAGAVMTTGDQSIQGVKTFSDGITIENQADVNFNASITTFGTGATVKFEGIDPQFKTDSVRFNGSGTQLLKKEGSGDFNIENQGGGNLTITNAASGTTKLKSSSGDLILESGQGVSDKVKINARDGIEVKLSHDNVNVSSPFKIIDANTQAGTETEVFTVDRSGDVTIKDANDNEIFSVKTSPNPGETLDFIRVGGPGGYKFPKLDPNVSLQNKALVVKDVPSTDPDFGKMEFRDFVATSIFDMSEVNETSTSIADGETLVWDDQTGKFVGQVALSDASLDDLSDVTLPASIPNNYALVWTGSTWEPQQQIDTDTTDLSTDTNPTLSADLDVNGNTITNELTDGGVVIRPNGNGDVTIGSTQGTGDITIGNGNTPTVSLGRLNFDSNQTLTGKNNYVLTYDENVNSIQLEPTALDLSGLSDVDTTGVSEGDVLVSDASGNFSPSSAFNAFMNAAVSVSTGMPQNGSVAGDFDGDGVVDINDLLVFLGNFGESAFDGNTQIEFVDVPIGPSDPGAAITVYEPTDSGGLNFNNYASQSTTSNLDLLNIGAATTTTSISPYAWSVNNTAESITLSTTDSTEFGEWFETSSFSFESPSTIYINESNSVSGLVGVTFALYAQVIRGYPTANLETDSPVVIADFGTVQQNTEGMSLLSNGPVSISDIGKKDAGNSERPNSVTIKLYVGVANDEGLAQFALNNLKIKVTGPSV